MSATIDAPPRSGNLPPPLLLGYPDASQLCFTLRGDLVGTVAVEMIAARSGEGTSTLVRDVCLVSAANGARTLLLAAENVARRPGWARDVYGMPNGLQPLAAPAGLQMVAVGDAPLALAAPPQALQPPAWVALLAELRGMFDFILVDAPALERDFLGIMLAPHLDGAAIVVQADSTRASTVRTLRDRLAEVGADTLGVVFNKRRFYVPRLAYDRL